MIRVRGATGLTVPAVVRGLPFTLQISGVRLLPADGVHVGRRGAGAAPCGEASALALAAPASAAGTLGAEASRAWSLRIDAAVGTYVVCWIDSLSGAMRPVGELNVEGLRLSNNSKSNFSLYFFDRQGITNM